ncbi:16S rRNA (adenine(1518)-N(6)/adenine(1519)-N(6))-dimethyltransferase RsmA [Patescibacteria group bacterium]
MKAKKSLGQNFLKDRSVLAKIIKAADLSRDDYVIEIGPGKGVLTHELLANAGRVTAIELDDRLIPQLKEIEGLDLIHANALDWIPPNEPYKVVANIPYYITSPLISHFLQAESRPSKMVLLVQKEVAEKIAAEPGDMNVLAIHVQVFGKPRIVCTAPAKAFTPAPKVDSAVIEIDVYDKPLVEDYKKFFGIMHRAFSNKRKMLSNSLHDIKDRLVELGFQDLRPENLSIEDWIKLLHQP